MIYNLDLELHIVADPLNLKLGASPPILPPVAVSPHVQAGLCGINGKIGSDYSDGPFHQSSETKRQHEVRIDR